MPREHEYPTESPRRDLVNAPKTPRAGVQFAAQNAAQNPDGPNLAPSPN